MEKWDALTEAKIDVIRTRSVEKEIWIDVTSNWDGEKPLQVIAHGVDDFVVNEMRLTNIIDRATRYDARDFPREQVAKRVFFLMRGREPELNDLDWPLLVEKMERIRTGDLTFLELEPVYGASVIILAKRFQLRQACIV